MVVTDISIDGDTNCAFTEDVGKRFESYGWQVLVVEDGDKSVLSSSAEQQQPDFNRYRDLEGIYNAIVEAKKVTDKPTIIKLRTTIGFGSKQQGTHGVHGSREMIGRYCTVDGPNSSTLQLSRQTTLQLSRPNLASTRKRSSMSTQRSTMFTKPPLIVVQRLRPSGLLVSKSMFRSTPRRVRNSSDESGASSQTVRTVLSTVFLR